MVSNCVTDSRREDYVRQMRQYITVDVYGACGDLTCQHDWENPACSRMLGRSIYMNFIDLQHTISERDYMFYLAFENSICVDYVTEKLFRTLELDLEPHILNLTSVGSSTSVALSGLREICCFQQTVFCHISALLFR